MRSPLDFLYKLFRLDHDVALQHVEAHLILLHGEIRQLMTQSKTQFDQLISAFNDETNALSTRLDSLKSQLAAALANGDQTMTVAETQQVLDEMTAISGRLQVLGADPTQPVPPADSNPPVPATAG